MSWDTELPTMLRYVIGDVDNPQSYSDDSLKKIIVFSAQLINGEVQLPTDYTIDLTLYTISPDPTNSATRDDAFITLIILKSACLLTSSESRIRTGQSISVKDVRTSLSTTDRARDSAKVAQTFCQEYKSAKEEFQTGQFPGSLARIKAVVSPFRFQHGGNEGFGT